MVLDWDMEAVGEGAGAGAAADGGDPEEVCGCGRELGYTTVVCVSSYVVKVGALSALAKVSS